MDRLTERRSNGVRYVNGKYTITCYPENNNLNDVDKLAVKLCEFEDKSEAGLLVELPCKVGDTVFGVGMNSCEDSTATDKKLKKAIFNECMKRNGDCVGCNYVRHKIEEFICTNIQISEKGILIIGAKCESYAPENIFTTMETAEARLKELQEQENDASLKNNA